MKITPEFMVTFETKVSGLVSSSWDRVASALQWDRLMKTRQSQSQIEIITWLLDSVQISNQGNGGNKRFDDMAAHSFSITNEEKGAGLRLFKSEIEDNQMRNDPSVSAMDYALNWGRQAGAAAAYEPQRQMVALLKAGESATGYDGVPFFSASHPVTPGTTGGLTYANLYTGSTYDVAGATDLTIAGTRFANALAAVSGQKFINGIPRYLKPTIVLAGTALDFRFRNLLGAKTINNTDNMIQSYGFEEPMILPEFDDQPTSYYIGCEDILSDELGGLIYSDREAYTMNSFAPLSSAELMRHKAFEWTLDGRDGATYGHPFLLFKFRP
jgi:phage major head subunit gpT-like protein